MHNLFFLKHMRLPLIGAPLFTLSNPELVIAQCRAGIIGSFPALNAREPGQLAQWFEIIQQGLDHPTNAAPYAVNIMVHPSNPRLDQHIELAVQYRAPIIITSLHAPTPVVDAAKSYGGLIWHDVTSLRHAEKAIQSGVDGLVLVCSGAGGHTGSLNPFAFVQEIRAIYSGTIILAGGMSRGHHILAARAMGADLAYMGTRFIASTESSAMPAYKQMILDSHTKDIICSAAFTGVQANFLVGSIELAGLDPKSLDLNNQSRLIPAHLREHKHGQQAWKDIWGAGQSVSGITSVLSTADIVDELEQEYLAAVKQLSMPGW